MPKHMRWSQCCNQAPIHSSTANAIFKTHIKEMCVAVPGETGVTNASGLKGCLARGLDNDPTGFPQDPSVLTDIKRKQIWGGLRLEVQS
jgi:hypothetical protein